MKLDETEGAFHFIDAETNIQFKKQIFFLISLVNFRSMEFFTRDPGHLFFTCCRTSSIMMSSEIIFLKL